MSGDGPTYMHKWDMMGFPSLSAADITHMLNVLSRTALCLSHAASAHKINVYVSTDRILAQPSRYSCRHTSNPHTQTVTSPMPTNGESVHELKNIISLFPSLSLSLSVYFSLTLSVFFTLLWIPGTQTHPHNSF